MSIHPIIISFILQSYMVINSQYFSNNSMSIETKHPKFWRSDRQNLNPDHLDIEPETKKIKVPILPSHKFFHKNANRKSTSKNKSKTKNNKQRTVSFFQQTQVLDLFQNSSKECLDSKQTRIDKNGHTIKGLFKNQKLDGKATIQYKNGDHFEGVFDNGVRKSGEYRFANGNQYKGEFLCECMNGQGTLFLKEKGLKITGRWKKNRISGIVQISYPNSDQYVGHLIDLKKEGQGTYIYHNGKKFKGNFRNGKIEGHGILYNCEGQILLRGFWKNGQLVQKDI